MGGFKGLAPRLPIPSTCSLTRNQMHMSLYSRREQMVSDGVMLTNDQVHWNSSHPEEEPIQLPLDLTFDVELRKNTLEKDDEAA
jgi:hypothetical protein